MQTRWQDVTAVYQTHALDLLRIRLNKPAGETLFHIIV